MTRFVTRIGGTCLHILQTQPLFAWDALEDSPSIKTLRQLLTVIPDQALLNSLRQARGHGRNEYPVSVLWGVLLLTIALRHTSIEACLQELQRNGALRQLLGIEHESQVPKKWNISRFLAVLGQSPHRELLTDVFNQMIQVLGVTVEDLGQRLAGDSTALCARGQKTGVVAGSSQASPTGKGPRLLALPVIDQPVPQACDQGLAVPTGGRKEYTDEHGVVTRVVTWTGYKLHLLVDAVNEVVIAYRISSAHVGDNTQLPPLLQDAKANLPAGRITSLAYDKACDDQATHLLLYQQHIHPIIQSRRLWKDEFERMLPGHDGHSNIVYDEAGSVYCYDKVSQPPVRHKMSYMGREAKRGTLKYRCPAAHYGLACPSMGRCNQDRPYGLTVRVKQEIDLRHFPPVPRSTRQFEKLYKGRTAVERVNARLKLFWGADDGNITGARRFYSYVGTVMVVHAAFATLLAAAPRRGTKTAGKLGTLHLGKVQKALQDKLHL